MDALAMQCPNCGFASGRIFYFCSGCGSTVPSGVAVEPPRDLARMKWGVLAATLVLPIVGMVLGGILIADARREQRALGRLWLIAGVMVACCDLALWLVI